MRSWAAGVGPLAELVAPVRSDGSLLPVGVATDEAWLSVCWYRGLGSPPEVTVLTPARPDEGFDGAPTLNWHLEPLPLGSLSDVDVQLSDGPATAVSSHSLSASLESYSLLVALSWNSSVCTASGTPHRIFLRSVLTHGTALVVAQALKGPGKTPAICSNPPAPRLVRRWQTSNSSSHVLGGLLTSRPVACQTATFIHKKWLAPTTTWGSVAVVPSYCASATEAG